MAEYFKPQRRKLGVVTLVIACVFAAGWVRSLHLTDTITIPFGKPGSAWFISDDGAYLVTWSNREKAPTADWESMPLGKRSRTGLVQESGDVELTLIDRIKDDLFPGYYERLKDRVGGTLRPYSVTVFSLTLVSAWLLCSKPRARPELTKT